LSPEWVLLNYLLNPLSWGLYLSTLSILCCRQMFIARCFGVPCGILVFLLLWIRTWFLVIL
jgi:hypothetical protein